MTSMIQKVVKEIPHLTESDCFTIFSRAKKNLNFPLHYHDTYELNLLINAKGAQRIIGNHNGTLGDIDLVLIGPNISHTWFTHQCTSNDIKEITIQFHKDLFDEKLLKKNQLFLIKNMLENAHRGILFSQDTVKVIADRIIELDKISGFDSVLEFLSIFHDLSVSRNMQMLSTPDFSNEKSHYNNNKIERVFEYIDSNYSKLITLADIAGVAKMSETSLSRLIKKQTGNTFVDHLNDIRLGHASKMLMETTHTIAEIANMCGYDNMSNFNRVFKSKKKCTPKEYREIYTVKTRVFV